MRVSELPEKFGSPSLNHPCRGFSPAIPGTQLFDSFHVQNFPPCRGGFRRRCRAVLSSGPPCSECRPPCPGAHEPADPREIALLAPTRAQPCRLVPVGRGSLRQGAQGKQAHLPVDRLFDLSLVPRHGAGILREPGHRKADERQLRVDQGRPRGTPGRGCHLHDLRSGDDRRGRLAHDGVLDPGTETLHRRHLFSGGRQRRPAGTENHPAQDCRRLAPTPPRDRQASRPDTRQAARVHDDPGRPARQGRARHRFA